MTLPPCYDPPDHEPETPDDNPADPSRREFMFGSAAATAGLFVTPIFGEEVRQSAAAKTAEDPSAVGVSLNVNGRDHELKLDPRTTLLDALREHLDLTGAKKGCDQGQLPTRTYRLVARLLPSGEVGVDSSSALIDASQPVSSRNCGRRC